MSLIERYDLLTQKLQTAGEYVWPLALRLILFWEFWEAGIGKFRGSNWFADIPWATWQKGFPWPFSVLPDDINWFLATWGEMVFSLMLLLGLFTRFTAVSLLVVTMVATAAVHWPGEWGSLADLWAGYVITSKGEGNYKLPLLFLVMLLPLVFHGGGRISLDRLLLRASSRSDTSGPTAVDTATAALALLVPGVALIWVEFAWGATLLAAAVVAALASRFRS